MKLPTKLRFTTHELCFLFATILVFAVGTLICVTGNRTKWMPGVGAIIIVLGVLFALSDLPAILQLQADKWAKVRKEFAVQNRINEVEEENHKVLTNDERRAIRCEEEAKTDRHLPSSGPIIRKRFRFVEVFIVCFGTVVNGFGQPVLELIQASCK